MSHRARSIVMTISLLAAGGCAHHAPQPIGPARDLAPRDVEASWRKKVPYGNELTLEMPGAAHITVYRVMPNENVTLYGLHQDTKAPPRVEIAVASGRQVVILAGPVLRLVQVDPSGRMFPDINRAAEGFGYLPKEQCPTATDPNRYCDVSARVPLTTAPGLKAHLVVVATREPVDSAKLSDALRSLDGSGEIDDVVQRLGRATASATSRAGAPVSNDWAARLGVIW